MLFHHFVSYLVFLSFLFVVCSPLFVLSISKDWYISPFGSDVNGNGSLSNPYQTLSKGISVSSNGDTIIAMPGGYAASQTISLSNLTIKSQQGYGTVFFSHPSLQFDNSATVIGITFEASGQSAISGYGCDDMVITIDSCGFSNNFVAVETACQNVFYITNSMFESNDQDISDQSATSITISNSVFQNSGGINTYTQLAITNSIFEFDGENSAIAVNDATLTLKNCTFSGCAAAENGGAITASNSIIDILNCHFTNNSAQQTGGAIYLSDGSLLTAFNSAFTDNTATSGGAFACDSSTNDIVEISNTTLVNNTAGGGCVY